MSVYLAMADQNSLVKEVVWSVYILVAHVAYMSAGVRSVSVCCYLDLQREVVTDGAEQCLGGFLSAHEHQLQVHVIFNQEAFGHQTDPHHST